MIKRMELTCPTSCLVSAGDEEPLFVLRANDELAPAIIRAWAVDYMKAKLNADQWGDRQHAKYMEAINLADEMVRWKATQSAKPGDV